VPADVSPTLLSTLPAETVRAIMRNPRGEAERVFTGPSLADFAVASGLVTESDLRAAPNASYFVVTAGDGACATVSATEALSRDDERCVILATTQDGAPLEVGVRLIVPEYPGLAGRSLMGVARVTYYSVPDVTSASAPAPGQVALDGLLERTGPLDLTTLAPDDITEIETPEMMGHGQQAIPPRRYSGVLLYRLLELAGIRLTPGNHEDFLRKVIVVTGTDGRAVVIAGGEVEPRFRAGQILLATHRDGQPLDDREGPVRLVIPYGRQPGRWTRDVVAVSLRDGDAEA